MHKWSQNWKSCSAGTWLCLTLAVCIFTWGMGYRMELCGPPHSAVHKLPVARLLSKNEHTWVGDSGQIARSISPAATPRSLHPEFGSAVPVAPGRDAEPVRAVQLTAERKLPTLLALNHFYARPPPMRA